MPGGEHLPEARDTENDRGKKKRHNRVHSPHGGILPRESDWSGEVRCAVGE